jgi:hypothetical protein
MPTTYNFKKGAHTPTWHWLRQFPGGNSNPGTSNQYDGVRYIYWLIQTGTASSGIASTTQLWRFDTWSNGWQFLATTTSGNNGMDLEYDPQRNVIYIVHGVALTSWQVFNLNTTSVTIAGTACAAWALTTMAPILLTAANLGSSFTQPAWQEVPGAIDVTIGTAPFTSTPTTGNLGSATVGTGSTTTNLITNATFFTPGMIGLQVTFGSATTTVALRNQSYIISAVASTGLSATVSAAMAGTPVASDTFVVTLPGGFVPNAASVQSTTTFQDTNQTWAVNQYANSDVVITNGTGAGQRRRIASNTANTLTLATAVTGNANTGVWSVTPDSTSVYQIQPSSDFLYYFAANGLTTAYKLDLSVSTGAAWTAITVTPAALAGGSNSFFPSETAPFSLLMTRGGGTATIYWYSIGLNSYITPTVFAASETFNTGSSSCLLHGKRRLLVTKESSQRNYILDLTTNILEPFAMSMYAAPSANDGKRVRYVKTADGVEWVYQIRAGGSELWRIPLEWL